MGRRQQPLALHQQRAIRVAVRFRAEPTIGGGRHRILKGAIIGSENGRVRFDRARSPMLLQLGFP